MAYRNHPTRYLIVKDPAAVAAGRFWAALVSLGKLRPAAHLVKLFFQLSFEAPLRFDRVADSATEGRIYARPSGPSTLFSTPTESLQSAVSRFPVRGVGLSTRPLAARQHIFSILLRGAVALRSVSGFPKSGGALLRPSLRPVNTFFSSPFRFRDPVVPGFPVRELGYLPNRHRPVNTFFQLVTRPPRKRHFRAATKWRYTRALWAVNGGSFIFQAAAILPMDCHKF